MTAVQPSDARDAAAARHIPVLLDEVLDALAVQPGEVHVDGTFGAGGYTRALLDAGASVYAIDRDPDAIAEGASAVDAAAGRLTLIAGCFGDMDALLAARDVGSVDGVVLDIGISSMQVDRAERGFSAMVDGPLDMTMSQAGPNAAQFLNEAAEDAIADVIFRYADEPRSRRIARAIVAARPLTTTTQLAGVIRRALHHRPHDKKDPAFHVFQAIRIHVNDELGELERGLAAAEHVLADGGRLAVVTFHSAEDRIVKSFLRARSGSGSSGSRHRPALVAGHAPTFAKPARAVRPSPAEIARNPRARSATLRSAVRTAAAAQAARSGASS